MRNLLTVGLRGLRGVDGGTIAPAAKRAAGLQARFALLVVLVCAGVLALGAGSAQALLLHTFSFGSSGSAGGDFNSPQGVAVDQSTGDVYVVDAGNFRVEKFTPDLTSQSGGFDLAFGENVNTGGGNVCTTAAACQAGTADTAAGAFESPVFVAVDNSGGSSEGDVYVGDPGDNTISKFDSSGNLITSFGTGGQLNGTGTSTFGSMDGITIDNSGNLLIIDGNNTVWEFTPAGGSITSFPTTRGEGPNGLDVNDAGNIFKVNGDSSVEELTSNGTDIGEVGGSTTELTIDRSTGDLYQDTGTSINHYQFDASGNVVDPGGPCAVVSEGSCAPTDTFGSGALSAGTGIGYDSTQSTLYAADAGNDAVAVFGPPSPGPPVIDSETTSNIGNESATLDAEVNPFGVDTTCTFQYVDDTDFQATGYTSATSVPCTPADLGNTFNDQSPSANITGLTLNTLYHFRVVATNADGTTTGNDTTFTTLGPASIDSESASNIGSTTAELDTAINPLGNDTTCQFQYVDDTDFSSTGFTGTNVVTVPCAPADLGAGNSDVSSLADISGLTPNTTYDFRAVATNTLGTENGTATQFTTGPPASIDSESASNIGSTSAELDTAINPEGTDTTCQLQYVDDTDFQSTGFTGPNVVTVACNPADLGAGIGDVSALADITGLTPSTLYDFRAVATNSLVPAGLDGSPTQFTTTPPVSIDSQSVTNITDTGATLKAQVNPDGLDTHVQFQYVTDADFSSSGYTDATTVPQNPIDIGSGTTDQPATVDLTGLTPGTKYHFRTVGTNSVGTANGTDQTFTTYASGISTGLPDGRGYEMVTPPNKDNGEPGNRNGLGGTGVAIDGQFISATTGNAFAYFSFDAFQGSQSDGGFYLANRGTSSWISQNLIPPQSTEGSLLCATLGGQVPFYTADMSKAVLEDGAALIPPCGADTPALVPGTCTSMTPTTLTTPCTGEPPAGELVQNMFVHDNTSGKYQLVNSYADAPSGVTPANATFDGASSDLSTVVFDESAQLTSDAPAGSDDLYEWSSSTGKDKLVSVLPDGTDVAGTLADGNDGQAFHAVSDDGSKIFFNANGNLYVRVNGSTTVQVDASQTTPAGTGGGGQFLAATSDGSTVFFTDDASAGLTGDTQANSGQNLYSFVLNSSGTGGTLTDLTPAADVEVQGLSGASDDGSYLYFVANGSLASGATAGQPNLYLLHGGKMTFIDTLNGGDSNDWTASSLTARVSGNGAFLAFTSTANLTSSNNDGFPEIYLYDSGANKISCASCEPTGVSPTAGATIDAPALSTPLLNSGTAYLQHNVSDTGQVFFDTPDALVPTDTNGEPDVYEYESGNVHLLSNGTSVDPSLFADATLNGSDAFFMTSSQLVPQDTDGAMDIYDARVGGGFPPSAPAPACQGEGCKPPESTTQPVPVVATVTFFGPGNVKGSSSSPAPKKKTKKKKKHAVIAVLTQRISGNRIKVRVTVPARGRLSVAGASLTRSSRFVRHAGAYTLMARLKPRAMAALETKHKLRLTIGVRYVPAGGHASAAVIKLTVKA